jgi:hypothetical protein
MVFLPPMHSAVEEVLVLESVHRVNRGQGSWVDGDHPEW